MTTARELKITAQDSHVLAATLFEPDANEHVRKISVQISSATGAPRGYYERFARFLADSGFQVITYDYRGMFDSRQGAVKDDPSRMRDWGEKDFAAVLDWLHNNSPDHQIVALGHSIGGTLMGLAPNNNLVTSAINVATPTAYWRYWSGLRKYQRLFEWYVLMPQVVETIGYLPARFAGGALAKGVALEWARWGRHRDFVVDEQGHPLHDGFHRFAGPMLFFSFTDDHFAPPSAVDAMRKLYSRATVEHRIIKPAEWGMPSIGHFAFFRKTAPQSAWMETVEWIAKTTLRA